MAIRHKVAILTSGSLQRYLLGQVVTGLIEPLVQQGHKVDYYLALNTAKFIPFHPEATEFQSELQGTVPELRAIIQERIAEAGGTVRQVDLVNGVPLSERDKAFLKGTKIVGAENLVKKDKMLEELWRHLTQMEKKEGSYTTVIILDDDSIWLRPFDLDRLHASSERHHPEGYALDCSSALNGKSMYRMNPPLFNDYIAILDREVAEPFGKQYSLLLSDSTSARNDETFWGQLVQRHNITLNRRPVGLVPMQRGGRQRGQHGEVSLCLHKLCDGEWGPEFPFMRPLTIIPACRSLHNLPAY